MRADTLCIAMLSVILLACPIASSYELDPDEILALGGPTAELSRLILQEREECCTEPVNTTRSSAPCTVCRLQPLGNCPT
jgi:hypothetical protein